MTYEPIAAQAPKSALPFKALLTPHRSLSPRGFVILMSCLGAASFVAGMAFLAIGAWPVFGFFGLDVALVYLAFKLNYRAGRAYETVEITHDTVQVTRVTPTGRRRVLKLNPYWARVRLDAAPDGRTTLVVAERDRKIVIGYFLTDEDREGLAVSIQAALQEARGGIRI